MFDNPNLFSAILVKYPVTQYVLKVLLELYYYFIYYTYFTILLYY